MDWKNKVWVRILAIIVFILMLVGAALSAAGLWACLEMHVYADGGVYLRREALDSLARSMDDDVESYYYDSLNGFDVYGKEHWESTFSPTTTNYFFQLKDVEGNILLSSQSRANQYHTSGTLDMWSVENVQGIEESFPSAAQRQVRLEELYQTVTVLDAEQYEGYNENDEVTSYYLRVDYTDTPPITIERYIAKDFTAKDQISFVMHWVDRLIAARNALPWLAGIFSILALAALIFLMILSARSTGNWFDRIPLDLLAAGYVGLVGVTFAILEEGYFGPNWLELVVLVLLGIVWVFLLLRFVISFIIRAKDGSLWKNTVTFRVLKLLWRFLKWFWGVISDLVKSIPLCWRTLLIWIGISFLEFLAIAAWGRNGQLAGFWFVEKVVLTPLLLFAVISMQRLQKGAKRIAEQGPGAPVDLTHMYGAFREHGENLNHISDGLQNAVQEQVKSERMKAELITNVSHDIKTPLTSIVNYVDLLQKQELKNETATEYVEVLSRQAARLKKLTEDLVEASKASTGNIAVNRTPTDLNVLVGQAAGEFADRFRQKELELVLSTAASAPIVLADGQLLWRVFSNLMTNIVKYALAGTRVYLSTAVQDGVASVTFRNISAAPLEKSGAELTERFVRGDVSRTGGDGSGLGLSIARSLTELQGGKFQITVDGDLFKAELQFPTEG